MTDVCSVCAGEGEALSGPCICGGLGSAGAEADGLRREIFRLREGLESEIERLDVRPGAPPGSRDYPQYASVQMEIRNRLKALLSDDG